MPDRNPTTSWRRVMVRLMVAASAALSQAVLLELVTLPNRRPVQWFEDQQSTSTSAQTKIIVTKAQLLSRTPLKDSTGQRNLMDKTICPHVAIALRGGKDRTGPTFWFTCKTCPTRWPRAEHEVLES